MTVHPPAPAAGVSRRGCLRWLGLPLAAFGLGGTAVAMPAAAAIAQKRLVLVTLNGGNDGLNTVVPRRDPLYRRLRPSVNVPLPSLLTLDADFGLHPQLRGLAQLFEAGEVALVHNVGYPDISLSHFESADVWNSGQTRRDARHEGWYGRVVMGNRPLFDAARFDAAAIAFDRSTGFANGRGVPVLIAGPDVSRERPAAPPVPARTGAQAPEALRRLAEMVNEGHEVQARVARRLQGRLRPQWEQYEDRLALQVEVAHWLMASGVSAPLLRILQDGYDTHASQLPRHAALLGGLDRALLDLRARLQADGLWDDTVVLVQSEFGRRAAQNGFDGTDHGTGAPVLLIGGRVRGGLYGAPPRLDDLDADGNVRFSTDFRRVYSSVVSRLWQLPVNPLAEAGHAPLDIALA